MQPNEPAGNTVSPEAVPPEKWMPEDPEVADVATWGTLEPPEYASDPEVIARIEANQRRLREVQSSDVTTQLGEQARAVADAGRAIDAQAEQFRRSNDPSERWQLWQQMSSASSPSSPEPSGEPTPPEPPA